MPETVEIKLCGHGWGVQHGIEAGLGLGRRDVPDRLKDPPVVEPVDPFQRGEFHGLEGSPGSAPMNDLGLVEAVHRLGERIVVGISYTSDRWLDAGASEALGVFDRDILNAAI